MLRRRRRRRQLLLRLLLRLRLRLRLWLRLRLCGDVDWSVHGAFVHLLNQCMFCRGPHAKQPAPSY